MQTIRGRISFSISLTATLPTATSSLMHLGFQIVIGCGGFIIVNAHKGIVVAGCSRINVESVLEVELAAMDIDLEVASEWEINIAVPFTYCSRAKQVLEQDSNDEDKPMSN